MVLDRDVDSRVRSYVHNLEVGSLKELPVRCLIIDKSGAEYPKTPDRSLKTCPIQISKVSKPPGLMNKWLLELIGEQHTSDVCSTDI